MHFAMVHLSANAPFEAVRLFIAISESSSQAQQTARSMKWSHAVPAAIQGPMPKSCSYLTNHTREVNDVSVNTFSLLENPSSPPNIPN
eukprot:3537193-Amphidinium_carterae.1